MFDTPLVQLEIDFENEGGETYICGNPPYKGSQGQTEDQKLDLQSIFDKRTTHWKSLDYVSGWFMKAADYGKHTLSIAAFVTTNSICQGRQVDTLWPLIFSMGHEIAFAHTSFKWTNLASHNAGVTVAIIGISSQIVRPRVIYSESDDSGTIVKIADNINAYLVSGTNLVVGQQSKPLSCICEMSFGNMPNDGGFLLLDKREAEKAEENHDVPRKFLRPFFGSHEYINGLERRCIWVTDEDYLSTKKNAWLRGRFEAVEEKRRSSNRATTAKLSELPFRFGEVRQKGNEAAIIVPIHSSESRLYLPVGLLPHGSIISNAAYSLFNAPLWNMALIASRLHLVWIATVCGKLETRYRYSNTLGWNTFPVPDLTDKNKTDLTRCAEDILLAREAHFPATIADLYDPANMPTNLREAHERNDEVLERIYIGRRFRNDTERLEKLFELYTKMTATKVSPNKSKRKADA